MWAGLRTVQLLSLLILNSILIVGLCDGDVFLALKGEHADGHDYVDNAIANGAAFSIVSKPVKGAFVLVEDVLAGVGKLAAHVRQELANLKVVGITGSQGDRKSVV